MQKDIDSPQATVQQLSSRITEAETRISMLQYGCNTWEETITELVKPVAILHNIHIVGVLEDLVKGDKTSAYTLEMTYLMKRYRSAKNL